jgi:hypothetical protein
MYPRDFFDTYWRTELRDEVFVAMPFHDEFTPVWDLAIRPAIETDSRTGFRANRVYASVLSGSIITDILDGIAHSRLVLADISIATEGRWKGQRSGNVMYEVGLAHAVRQASEILLIRSDEDPINFDIAQIHVHRYHREDLSYTRAQLSQLVVDVLKQIEQEKSLKVQRAIDQLDADAFRYLAEFAVHGPFVGPDPQNMGGALLAISNRVALNRLQQLGILRATRAIADERTVFVLTAFGTAVSRALGLKDAAAQPGAAADAQQTARG